MGSEASSTRGRCGGGVEGGGGRGCVVILSAVTNWYWQ